MSNCLIIGGGPVALSIACRAYLEAKIVDQTVEPKITVYEKRVEYTRDFSIKVKKDALNAFRISESLAENEDLKEKIRAYNKCIPKAGGVIVNQMEKALANCAKAFKINIINREVTKENFNDLLKEQNPSVVLGASGTHCAITKLAFPEDNRILSPVGSVLQVKFKSDRNVRFGKFSGSQIGRFHLPIWFKKLEDGSYSGQSFMTLSAEETKILNNVYPEKIKFTEADFRANNAQFKMLPKPLQKSINCIKDIFRDYEAKSNSVEEMTMPLVKLDSYKSKKYSTTYSADGKEYTVITAGNAAGGVPYQRSFNACLKTVAVASKVLAAGILGKDNEKAIKEFDGQSTKIWNSYYKWTKVYTFFVKVADKIYYLFAKFLDLFVFWKKK